MAIPGSNTDRVQVTKLESPGKGGTEDDELIPSEIDATEDAISARGLYGQPEGGPLDEDVWIGRDGDDWKFKDKNTGPHTLSTLAAAGADTKLICMSFASNDGKLGLQVSTDSYELKGNFLWPGTSYIGNPASIKATFKLETAGTGYLRIYDLTNAQQIAEGFVSTPVDQWAFFDLGTLSNVPSGEAIWEFQLKSVGTPKDPEFIIGALQIKF